MYYCDADYVIDIGDFGTVSTGTEFCVECRKIIPVGTEHYIAYGSDTDEYGDDLHLFKHTVCEECGDLALSVMDIGLCWGFGDLQADIKEMKDW